LRNCFSASSSPPCVCVRKRRMGSIYAPHIHIHIYALTFE
jgi:hypothetical protein